jgi:uroporphyrinogen-III synthase
VSGSEQRKRGLEGLRVLSLQSRHSAEIAQLIENAGGVAVRAPAMREVPVRDNPAALQFAENLLQAKFDLVIFLTGVGARMLLEAVETTYPKEKFVEALRRLPVVVRGPKPAGVMRELGVPVALLVPEPNTWRDLLKAIDEDPRLTPLQAKRIAIQEYGVPNWELVEALESRGAAVTRVPVYQWALPDDLEPLRRGIEEIVTGKIDVLLVTSAAQADHMMQVAWADGLGEAMRRALQRVLVVSIGPISTEGLERHGIAADLEPAHPKMGQLVYETAEKARDLLRQKRGQAG